MEGLIGLFRWRDWAKYGADSQLSASLMYSETVAKSCHSHDCVRSTVEGYKHPSAVPCTASSITYVHESGTWHHACKSGKSGSL